jgi:hypothetical protein
MAGGLLNIISFGNQNIILNGNPTTTMFKAVYLKYTNFGLQKFRLDFEGQKNLNLNSDLELSFKITRHADLLLDTYLVFNLPDIWSPILPPQNYLDCWKPYHFRWIKHIGANIIKKASLVINGQTIQSFTGEYLKTLVNRDFPSSKREKFYKMIGHEEEIYSPEYAYKRPNRYPTSFFQPNIVPEPSIRGRTIYVPLHFWFSFSSKHALPLVSLQNSEVYINLTLRPIRDLFTINDITKNKENNFNTDNPIRPNFINELHLPYRFFSPPKDFLLSSQYYNRNNNWDTDIHLMSTYGFLTMEEARVFALNEQKYLIKDVYENDYLNIVGNNTFRIETNSLATSWIWFFRRHDHTERNEFSNYSNWKYHNMITSELIPAPEISEYVVGDTTIGPGLDFDGITNIDGIINYKIKNSQYYITPPQDINNNKNIMTRCSILFDGQNREHDFDAGIYHYIEKYKACEGGIEYDGLYSYSYGLNTSPFETQPSGAINLSKFKRIELAVSTILPSIDASNVEFKVICDIEGTPIGKVENQNNSIYDHTFDLHFMEERYNLVRIVGGQAGLIFAR